jgi:hypothetical protein
VNAHGRCYVYLQAEELVLGAGVAEVVVLPGAGVEVAEGEGAEVEALGWHYIHEVGLVEELVVVEFANEKARLIGVPLVVDKSRFTVDAFLSVAV